MGHLPLAPPRAGVLRPTIERAVQDRLTDVERESDFGTVYDEGQYELASRDVAAGLAIDPDNPHLLCLRGDPHAEANEDDLACAAYLRAAEHAPTLAAAWAGLAAMAHRSGDPHGAISYLDRVLADNDQAALYYNRALVYAELGQLDLALADLEQAVVLDPDDPQIRAELTRCRATAGPAGSRTP